jgi:integrase/recombinase XerD
MNYEMDKAEYIKYLENRGLQTRTINYRIKFVTEFFAKTKKEDLQVTKPDILKFLEHLKNSRKIQNTTRYHYLNALNHYFTMLYNDGKIAENPCLLLKIRGIKRKKMYKIYTSEELDLLFDNYYQYFVRNFDNSYMPKNARKVSAVNKEKNALILSILVYQGATTWEIEKIELEDIDLIKGTLKIRGGLHSNGRILPLKASQIRLIMNYLQNIRPQLIEYHKKESNLLFLASFDVGKGEKKINNKETLKLSVCTFLNLSKQVKMIDKQFFNFKQVRASVITNWLKTEGLRKAQYFAGHRYVSSTEAYQPNNLDDLIDNINKLHPLL